MGNDLRGQHINLIGADALERVLRELPDTIAERELVTATRAGAQVIRKDALTRLGGAGDRKDIVVRRVRGPEASVHLRIMLASKAFHLMFREFGTAPHKITVRRRRRGGAAPAKQLFDATLGIGFGREVQHPGQRAQPFMRPALDSKTDEAIAKVGDRLRRRVLKAAERLAGKYRTSGLARKKGRRR